MNPINICIFGSREDRDTLSRTVLAVKDGYRESAVLDVLINGNERLLEEMKDELQRGSLRNCEQLRLWSIPYGDKANAYNEYIHKIANPNLDSVFIDGYIRPTPGSIGQLRQTFAEFPESIGTSAVPSMGFAARSLRERALRLGGFNGSLCAIRSSAILEMRRRTIRIPLGIYRKDSFLNSIFSWGLNNLNNEWEPFRWIPVTRTATWERDRRNYFRAKDLLDLEQRWFRQIRGRFESAAIKYYMAILRTLPEDVPKDAQSLVNGWREACPDELNKLPFRLPHFRLAVRFYDRFEMPDEQDLHATLAAERG
jgi:hypothetical protein